MTFQRTSHVLALASYRGVCRNRPLPRIKKMILKPPPTPHQKDDPETQHTSAAASFCRSGRWLGRQQTERLLLLAAAAPQACPALGVLPITPHLCLWPVGQQVVAPHLSRDASVHSISAKHTCGGGGGDKFMSDSVLFGCNQDTIRSNLLLRQPVVSLAASATTMYYCWLRALKMT